MKNIVEIKNVKNVVTEQVGTLYLIASKDREATNLDKVEHQGLSIFFRPEGDSMPTYVKSFVFMQLEAVQMRRGSLTIMRDIGYILDVSNLTLDILCLDTGMEFEPKPDSLFGNQKITRTLFSLEFTDNKGYDLLNAESKQNRHNMTGFRLAIAKAFTEMINITDDSIVPSRFPEEANVLEIDYKL